LDDISVGFAKVQVVHTAAAPAVDVQFKGKGPKPKIRDLGPGEQSFADQLSTTPYNVQIKPAAGGKPVLKLDGVSFSGDAYTSVFAVGSPVSGTFTVVPVEVSP
jgi:hypothetical protein